MSLKPPKLKPPFKKGYHYEIKPTKDQRDYLHMAFGHCRFVWNQCLERLNKEYETYLASGPDKDSRDDNLKPKYDICSLSKSLTAMKSINPWLYDVSNVALQQTTRHLSQAYMSFFGSLAAKLKSKSKRKVGLPKFKSKYRKQSISLMSNGFTFDGDDLYIAKISDPIKVYWSRDLPSIPTSITISRETDGRYYVSFTCDYIPPKTSGIGVVGIDLGVRNLYVDSDGYKEESLVALLAPIEKTIKRLQRHLSRQDKDSHGYQKTKLRLNKWHKKLTHVRNDILHKLSRRLVDNNHVIVLETLSVANMLKCHNRAHGIIISSWSKFVQYILYKARDSQHTVVGRAHPFFPSSKTCNTCGVINSDLKSGNVYWTCKHCHTRHQRDENASYNLKSLFIDWVNRTNPDLEDYAGCVALL